MSSETSRFIVLNMVKKKVDISHHFFDFLTSCKISFSDKWYDIAQSVKFGEVQLRFSFGMYFYLSGVCVRQTRFEIFSYQILQ